MMLIKCVRALTSKPARPSIHPVATASTYQFQFQRENRRNNKSGHKKPSAKIKAPLFCCCGCCLINCDWMHELWLVLLYSVRMNRWCWWRNENCFQQMKTIYQLYQNICILFAKYLICVFAHFYLSLSLSLRFFPHIYIWILCCSVCSSALIAYYKQNEWIQINWKIDINTAYNHQFSGDKIPQIKLITNC